MNKEMFCSLTILQQTGSWCKCRQSSLKRKSHIIRNKLHLLVHTLDIKPLTGQFTSYSFVFIMEPSLAHFDELHPSRYR